MDDRYHLEGQIVLDTTLLCRSVWCYLSLTAVCFLQLDKDSSRSTISEQITCHLPLYNVIGNIFANIR